MSYRRKRNQLKHNGSSCSEILFVNTITYKHWNNQQNLKTECRKPISILNFSDFECQFDEDQPTKIKVSSFIDIWKSSGTSRRTTCTEMQIKTKRSRHGNKKNLHAMKHLYGVNHPIK